MKGIRMVTAWKVSVFSRIWTEYVPERLHQKDFTKTPLLLQSSFPKIKDGGVREKRNKSNGADEDSKKKVE